MRRIPSSLLAVVLSLTCLVSSAPLVAGGAAVVQPAAGLRWAAGAVPQVAMAAVEGDPAKGPGHFFLRYAAGFVTPTHHHSADHYVTLVSGSLVLTAAGKEHRLTPGSYFAFTGGAVHTARCEGSQDCVMFVDARAAWDVVMEEAAKR